MKAKERIEMKDEMTLDQSINKDFVLAEAELNLPILNESQIVYNAVTHIYGSSMNAQNYDKHRNMKYKLVHYHIFNEFIPFMLKCYKE